MLLSWEEVYRELPKAISVTTWGEPTGNQIKVVEKRAWEIERILDPAMPEIYPWALFIFTFKKILVIVRGREEGIGEKGEED